jgi:hypothetical protein
VLIEELVYLDRDNEIVLRLSSDGTAITHSGLTRIQLLAGDSLLDSIVTPSLFDFTQSDRLILKLGGSNLSPGRYPTKLYVFDESHSLGIFWDEFMLVVK